MFVQVQALQHCSKGSQVPTSLRVCSELVGVKWFWPDFGFKCKQESRFCPGHARRTPESLCSAKEVIREGPATASGIRATRRRGNSHCGLLHGEAGAYLTMKSLRTVKAICFQKRNQQFIPHSQDDSQEHPENQEHEPPGGRDAKKYATKLPTGC